MPQLTSKEAALAAASAMDDKKADNVQVLRMTDVMVDADYFVIGSCDVTPQMRSIVEAVEDSMEQLNFTLLRREGRDDSGWVLLDYGSVVVHVFLNPEREYYNLEKLWADAERIPLPEKNMSIEGN